MQPVSKCSPPMLVTCAEARAIYLLSDCLFISVCVFIGWCVCVLQFSEPPVGVALRPVFALHLSRAARAVNHLRGSTQTHLGPSGGNLSPAQFGSGWEQQLQLSRSRWWSEPRIEQVLPAETSTFLADKRPRSTANKTLRRIKQTVRAASA